MPENARLNGYLDDIDVDFMEREATPQLFMKLGIQLHLAGLSLSNTVTILEIFGVERARSTIHNWVHKTDLQPEAGRSPDHVAVEEAVFLVDGSHSLQDVCRRQGFDLRDKRHGRPQMYSNRRIEKEY